jgi:Protein of unknown function (DUF3078)
MKKVLSLCAVLSLSIAVFAQNVATSGTQKVNKHGWASGASFYAGLTQVGNNNWYSTGSDKFTLSAMATFEGYANKKWKKTEWTNEASAAYGMLNTTSQGVTKLNDRLDLSSKLTYTPKDWKHWSVGSYAAVRTQFSDGYFYNYMGEQGVKRRKSGFFAPAFITASVLGFQWKPNSWFNAYVSPLTARWTIVTNQPYSYLAQGGVYKGMAENSLASLYNVNPTTQHKGEFGLYLQASAKKEVMKNISYNGKIEIFGNYINAYKNVLPSRFVNFDVFMRNQIEFNVNKLIKVRYNLDLMYDDDMKQTNNSAIAAPSRSVGLQVLSTLGVGVSYKL